MMNKTLKFVLILLLLLCAFAGNSAESAPAEPDLDGEIAVQQKARDDLDKKIQQYNETVKKKEQQAKGLLGRLTDLQQNSKMAQQEIKLLELQSNKLQKSMTELNREMAEINRNVDSLVRELRTRMVDMYKYGSREDLNLLLSAENTHEAISTAYLLERLARQDQLMIEELLNKISKLEQAKQSLDKNRHQLASRTSELKIQREKYNSTITETNQVLTGVQRDKQKAEAAAKETERAQQEIGRTIMALLQRKKQRTAEPAPSSGNAAVATQPRDYPVLARGSMLDWPLKGPIASPFGSRVHPVFKTKSFNSGIDIRAASGATVKAAGPGEVLFEGWLRGFGQVVIIDHGRNISTVYAHLSSTRVKERDAVQSGTVIGTVGNTGTTEGYSLHFEVRVGDAAKNPLDYLKKA